MRLAMLLPLLFAARAGMPAAVGRPPEFRPRRGHGGYGGRGRHQSAWRRERAERALARLDVARAARAGRAVLLEASAGHVHPPGHEITTSMQFAAKGDIAVWRRLRNAAKARRCAIRAAGGQA